MPATIATIAQNSVVLNACFVSVVSRATTPRGAVLVRARADCTANEPLPRMETPRGPQVDVIYPGPGALNEQPPVGCANPVTLLVRIRG
jgi:hypothetical protein